MSRAYKIRFAKVLIAFSIILIFIGIFIHVESTNKFSDPVKDVEVVISDSDDDISITTVDEEVITVEDKSDNITDKNQEVVVPNGSSDITNNDFTTDANTNSDIIPNDIITVPNTENNNVVVTPPADVSPSIVENNNNLRSDIQKKYGIKVKYGDETDGYSVGGLSTVMLADNNIIQESLNNLSSSLALYPTDFFKEMRNKGFSLTIYLIQKYSTKNVTGITDHSSKDVVISIATDFDLASSLNHEVFHYIDYYVIEEGGSYASWGNYNPPRYNYGNVDSKLSYNRTFSEDAYFVNNYAQTDEYEDRASTFEYMMADSKASCLNYGKTVWLKAKYMAEQIDYFYETVSPNVTEYWERFIY